MRSICALIAGFAAVVVAGAGKGADTWRGIPIEAEYRCSEYNRKADYRYSQSVEQKIIDAIGKIYGPYTGTCFNSRFDTDIEHIVATSEAHDSGLCAEDRRTRMKFASDLRNLTLASPYVNRSRKGGKDAGEWMPQMNRCWFAAKVVEVRLAYGLTIDAREAVALERVLSQCESTQLIVNECPAQAPRESSLPSSHSDNSSVDALALYDDNGNGRITCAEARRHRIAPVPRDHPAYPFMSDRDGDGVVCE